MKTPRIDFGRPVYNGWILIAMETLRQDNGVEICTAKFARVQDGWFKKLRNSITVIFSGKKRAN